MKLSHENGGLLKIILLLAHIGLSVQKYATNMDHVKGEDPPESIGASFLKISWLEPEILQFKKWFQVKSSITD